MDRDNKAGGQKTCIEFERNSLEPEHRPPVIGWLCCRINEEFQPGFFPLAIFRDRLTALLYAYSLSTPQKQENKDFKIFIEDGTNGYEDPPARAADPTVGMTLDESAYVERLKAKICEADYQYEGVDNDFEDFPDLTFVFPLRVMNPPMDTISPHVKLTCSICPASKGIVLSKCEGCDYRQHSRYMPSGNSRLACEVEVEYFPFGVPYLFNSKKFANKLSTCLAEYYPDVTCMKEIPTDLALRVVSFLPIEHIIGFIKLPVERQAITETEFKQHIIFSLPKRIATSLETSSRSYAIRPGYDYTVNFHDVNAKEDFWELNAKFSKLKYSVNDIPEDANWSSLGIVVIDDTEDSAVRKVVSFLHNRIPSKYLSEGSKCVVDLLFISKEEVKECRSGMDALEGNRRYAESLKLEFYTANGSKHCDWYLLKAYLCSRLSDSDCSEFLQNSTFVYLKDSSSNSNGESDELGLADIEINNLASYLLTAYDHSKGISCDSNRDEDSLISSVPLTIAELHFKQLPSVHSQNIALFLNETLMDVSNWTLRQLWTKIANLFQISNFSFINHQDQTTPVNTPTDLVVLTDYNPDEDYLSGIENSALATAYRNNSGCLKALESFDVNVVVLSIGRYGRYSRGEVREVYRYQLKMSRAHMCEVFYIGCFPTCSSGRYEKDYYSSHDPLDVIFDVLACLRNRPLQVECWDRGQGSPPFRNPFGFAPDPYEFDDVVFPYEHAQEDRPAFYEDEDEDDDEDYYYGGAFDSDRNT